MSEPMATYRTGQSVRVIPGVRNNTPRRGVVAAFQRHFKDECFNYFIRQCDKRVSKCYRDADLIADTPDPAWLSETVVALATGIVVHLAFDRLPVLADALEEAGCDDAEVLNHLRSGRPHRYQCWAVDLILCESPRSA